jgi:hypothetical protein
VTDIVKVNEKDVESNNVNPNSNIIAVTEVQDPLFTFEKKNETVSSTNKNVVPNNPLGNNNVTQRISPAFNPIEGEGSEEMVRGHGGLKGFLRKATRVFEKRTNIQTTTDDDKLLIGAFAVSLK